MNNYTFAIYEHLVVCINKCSYEKRGSFLHINFLVVFVYIDIYINVHKHIYILDVYQFSSCI